MSEEIDSFKTRNDNAIKKAREELIKTKEKWDSFFLELRTDEKRSLSPDQIHTIRKNLRSDFHLLWSHYIMSIHDRKEQNDVYQDGWSFFIHTDSKIDIAIQKGEQNFRNEIHQQKMEFWERIGDFLKKTGVNLGYILVGALATYGGMKFYGVCPL